MTLLKILESSTEYLKERGVESPRLQAELLLGYVLKIPRLQLYVQFDRELAEHELEKFRALLKRRGQREPLQHIIGETSFCGLTLKCSPAALIPRPETEMLVEWAVSYLKEKSSGLVYDVGTGCGAIAFVLARQLPGWRVVATDISGEALELARKNHSLYPDLNISWQQSSLLEGQTEPAAAVVANLPYLTSEEMDSLPAEVRADPALALNGGKDGLDLIHRLIPQATQLSESLFLEIGPAQSDAVVQLAQKNGFSSVAVKSDLAGRQRFVIANAQTC